MSPRKYTEAFKAEAVKWVLEQHYSQAEAAASLGISSKNINRWVRACKQPEAQGLVSAEQRELQHLRAQVKRLQMERDILKKAAAFFANESP